MGGLDGSSPTCAKWDALIGRQRRRILRSPFSFPRRIPMPGTELRGPSAHTRIGPQRGRLRNAAIVFEQISADVDAKPDTWLVAVRVALDGLADAWHEHVAFTEGPHGLFEELLDESVEVAPEIDRLRRDHEILDSQVARAREL